MAVFKISWYIGFCIILLLVNICIAALGNCGQKYTIKGVDTHLVLDGVSDTFLTIQQPIRTPQQKWQFVRTNSAGLFNIFNNYTGTVLTIYDEDCVDNVTYPYCLVKLSPLHSNNHRQQWFINSKGSITNLYTNLNLDIKSAVYEPGTYVMGFTQADGYLQQIFEFEETN